VRPIGSGNIACFSASSPQALSSGDGPLSASTRDPVLGLIKSLSCDSGELRGSSVTLRFTRGVFLCSRVVRRTAQDGGILCGNSG
jgi:hypothetical protein